MSKCTQVKYIYWKIYLPKGTTYLSWLKQQLSCSAIPDWHLKISKRKNDLASQLLVWKLSSSCRLIKLLAPCSHLHAGILKVIRWHSVNFHGDASELPSATITTQVPLICNRCHWHFFFCVKPHFMIHAFFSCQTDTSTILFWPNSLKFSLPIGSAGKNIVFLYIYTSVL